MKSYSLTLNEKKKVLPWLLLHKSKSQNFHSPSNPSSTVSLAQQVLERVSGDCVLTVTQTFKLGWQVMFGTLDEPDKQSSSIRREVDEQL